MAEDFERVESRLNNIASVRPILGALRTISLGSWQSALRKQDSVQAFEVHFREILSMLMEDLPQAARGKNMQYVMNREDTISATRRRIYLIIGSERGLCGGFNSALLRFARNLFNHEDEQTAEPYEVWVLGSRLYRMMVHAGIPVQWAKALSTTALPDYQMAHELTSTWIRFYEAFQVDQVQVIYNQYTGPGSYKTLQKQMIPPVMNLHLDNRLNKEESFPPPIIETDPVGIYTRVLAQLATMSMYQCLLTSAASEHSARYALMEEAGQNSDRLIEEMTEVLQMYRRQSITQEMQELAAGSGLLG